MDLGLIKCRNGVKLCADCREYKENDNLFDSGDQYKQDDGNIILNELLAYLSHYYDSCNFDSLKTAILDGFLPQEITEARNILWENCGEYLHQYKDKRSSQNRSALEAQVNDILEGFRTLDRTQCSVPIFAATNLDRLPKFGPGELDIVAMVQHVIDLEGKVNHLTGNVAKHTTDIKTLFGIQYQKASFANAVKSATPSSPGQSPNVCMQSLPVLHPSGSSPSHIYVTKSTLSAEDKCHKDLTMNEERPSDGDNYVIKKALSRMNCAGSTEENKTVTNESQLECVENKNMTYDDDEVDNTEEKTNHDTGSDADDKEDELIVVSVHLPETENKIQTQNDGPQSINSNDEDFRLPTHQVKAARRNQRRQDNGKKPVYGTLTDSSLRGINGREKKIELFVFNLEPETGDSKLLDYFKKRNVPLMEYECRSKPDYRSKSYRIAVNPRYVKTVLSETFWPRGIGCRYYNRKRMVNSNNQNGSHEQVK